MENLGINIISVITYILIFVVLYFAVKKFVVRILCIMQERKKIIEKSLKDAKDIENLRLVSITKAEEEREAILKQAYDHAKEVISKAEAREVSLLKSARKKAEEIILNSREEIVALQNKARDDGIKEAKDIIKLAINKSFYNVEIDSILEEKIIEESLKNIKKYD